MGTTTATEIRLDRLVWRLSWAVALRELTSGSHRGTWLWADNVQARWRAWAQRQPGGAAALGV